MSSTKSNPFKGTSSPEKDHSKKFQDERRLAINKICDCFVTPSDRFDPEYVLGKMREYRKVYTRWIYSDITNYIFKECGIGIEGIFNQNLDNLEGYIYSQAERKVTNSKGQTGEKFNSDPDLIMFDKFSDHVNLAFVQKGLMDTSDKNFENKFDDYAKPYADGLYSKLNKELISLVSIFTALSFLVFGGIQSLDNIFTDVGSVPIVELIIVGCVWSLGILNLVFSFLYLISKLTKLSLRATENDNAKLAQKYPFWVWSNFSLFFLLSIFCWIYYVDYSNSGSWLIKWSHDHNIQSTIGGTIFILAFFGLVAYGLGRRRKKVRSNSRSI